MKGSIFWWHGYMRLAYKWVCAFIDFYNCHFVKKILYCCPWVPQLKTVFNRTMLVALCTIWCLFQYLNIYYSFLTMYVVCLIHRSLCCFAIIFKETTDFYYLEWVPLLWTYCYTGSTALQTLSHFIRGQLPGSRGRVQCGALAWRVQGFMCSRQHCNKTDSVWKGRPGALHTGWVLY